MARADTSQLYQNLIKTGFNFMPPGRYDITEIYTGVRSQFQNLCDDRYLCSQNCQSGTDQPEWKHIVRGALDALKDKKITQIRKDPQRGFWIFR